MIQGLARFSKYVEVVLVIVEANAAQADLVSATEEDLIIGKRLSS